MTLGSPLFEMLCIAGAGCIIVRACESPVGFWRKATQSAAGLGLFLVAVVLGF